MQGRGPCGETRELCKWEGRWYRREGYMAAKPTHQWQAIGCRYSIKNICFPAVTCGRSRLWTPSVIPYFEVSQTNVRGRQLQSKGTYRTPILSCLLLWLRSSRRGRETPRAAALRREGNWNGSGRRRKKCGLPTSETPDKVSRCY